MLLTGVRNTLTTAGGDPIPPQSVVRRLQEISPRLSLVWVGGGHVRYWGLRETWRHGDPRWEQVQTGRIPADMAYDVAQVFPPDCGTEEIAAFVERYYGERNMLPKAAAAKEAERMVDAQRHAQKRVHAENVERVSQESIERHERESRHDLRVRAGAEKAHPMVVVP